MQNSQSRGGALVLGLLLIAVGVGAIVVRQSGLELSWPAWVIVPGIGLFLAAFALPVPAGSGLAAAGAIVTAVGGVLAFQEATGAYATWAYAWALVAPGGVGLGLFLYGTLTRRGEIARGGLSALVTGLALFLAFFVFFEGAIGLNRGRFGDISGALVPGALVAIGIIVIVGAIVPGPWRAPAEAPKVGAPGGWTAWTAPNAPGPTTSPSAAQATAPAAAPVADPAAAPVADPAAAPAAAPNEGVNLPLAGAPDAEVRIAFGAGRLAVGVAQPGRLAEGTCSGGVDVTPGALGRVRFAAPLPPLNLTRIPFNWQLGLTGEVPLRLEVETGASDSDLDLRLLRCSDLRLRVGAANVKVALPAAAGLTRVDAEGGAASIRFTVPQGVAARIRSSMTLATTDVDTARFPAEPDGRTWSSPDFATAANRVEIEVRGGAGSVSVG